MGPGLGRDNVVLLEHGIDGREGQGDGCLCGARRLADQRRGAGKAVILIDWDDGHPNATGRFPEFWGQGDSALPHWAELEMLGQLARVSGEQRSQTELDHHQAARSGAWGAVQYLRTLSEVLSCCTGTGTGHLPEPHNELQYVIGHLYVCFTSLLHEAMADLSTCTFAGQRVWTYCGMNMARSSGGRWGNCSHDTAEIAGFSLAGAHNADQSLM